MPIPEKLAITFDKIENEQDKEVEPKKSLVESSYHFGEYIIRQKENVDAYPQKYKPRIGPR